MTNRMSSEYDPPKTLSLKVARGHHCVSRITSTFAFRGSSTRLVSDLEIGSHLMLIPQIHRMVRQETIHARPLSGLRKEKKDASHSFPFV